MIEKIKEIFNKCSYAKPDSYDNATKTFHIPKYSKPVYSVGKCYLIKLPDYLINNKNTILATNWNAGRAPEHKYLKAYINKILPGMIFVDAIYYDDSLNADIAGKMFSGYLEIKEIEQIKEI